MTIVPVTKTAHLTPGALMDAKTTTQRGALVLYTAHDEPGIALALEGVLSQWEAGQVALLIGDAALLQRDPNLAQDAYTLAVRRFRDYTRDRALGAACAHYGLALVAYGSRDYWQALGEIDAALACIGEWVTLQDNGLGYILEALGDDILTRSHFERSRREKANALSR